MSLRGHADTVDLVEDETAATVRVENGGATILATARGDVDSDDLAEAFREAEAQLEVSTYIRQTATESRELLADGTGEAPSQ